MIFDLPPVYTGSTGAPTAWKELFVITDKEPQKRRKGAALAYVPAAALTILAGYGGVAGLIDAGEHDSVPVVVSSFEEASDGMVPLSADGYAACLVSGAVSALAAHDAKGLESLFSESVRNAGVSAGVKELFGFLRGPVCCRGGMELFHGARARSEDGTGVRYEYVNAMAGGIWAGGHEYEARAAVFVDGDDAARNRGLATFSLLDKSVSPEKGVHCVSVGMLPVC